MIFLFICYKQIFLLIKIIFKFKFIKLLFILFKIQHLDMEFESPEMPRKENIFIPRDNKQLHRTRSAYKDPGVIGPIVWDLRRQQKALSGQN